ncbi:MAG: RNA polymerase sigma factor [Betaproteobacteria bacterium]
MSIVRVSDDELVARARRGDQAAFGELVDRHRAAVYRAALAALGSHADADDAAQEAFVAAFSRLDRFRGESTFKTWLLTIAWHQAINQRRSRMRWWRRVAQGGPSDREAEPERPDGDPTPEQSLHERRLRAAIRDALVALRPALRDTFVLVQAGDYTYEEIAAMQRKPLGTIKWRVSEARRQIKRRLHEQGYGDV